MYSAHCILLWMSILDMPWCTNREKPKWNLIFKIRSTRRCESAHEEDDWPTHQTRRMTHGRKENKCGGRSGINWKLANCECVTFLIHAHSYPSEDFGEIFRTRLENKVGTMTGETSPGNGVRGAFKWRNAEPEKRDPRGGPTGSSPSAQESLYRTHETGPPFQPPPSSSPAPLLSSSSCEISPPRRQMYVRGARVLALFSLWIPWARVSLGSKRTVLQLDEVLTSLSRTHLSFVRPVDRRGSPLFLSGHSSTTPDLTPPGTPLAAAISLAMLATFSHGAHDFAPWIRTSVSSCPADLHINPLSTEGAYYNMIIYVRI